MPKAASSAVLSDQADLNASCMSWCRSKHGQPQKLRKRQRIRQSVGTPQEPPSRYAYALDDTCHSRCNYKICQHFLQSEQQMYLCSSAQDPDLSVYKSKGELFWSSSCVTFHYSVQQHVIAADQAPPFICTCMGYGWPYVPSGFTCSSHNGHEHVLLSVSSQSFIGNISPTSMC